MKKIIAIMFVLGLVGCGGGGATNNDQGVAFTLLGFTTEEACTDSATGPNLSGLTTVFSESTESEASRAGAVVAGYFMRNNLCKQFIRTDQAFLEFFIPGASVQPPSTSVALGAFMDPTFDDCDGEIAGASESEACAVTSIVPNEIRQWLVLNRNSIPELPFTMQVRATVSGLTSAGDRLDSNEAVINVRFVPDVVIEPGSGEEADPDAGAITETDSDTVDSDVTPTPELDVPTEGTDTDGQL